MLRRKILPTACLLAAATVLPLRAFYQAEDDRSGGGGSYVYTMTNAAASNAVMVLHQNNDGSLTPVGPVPTGGRGTGAGLGSQGSLVLTNSGRWLLAVNAGSDDISVFRVSSHGMLTLASRTASGGTMPISLTVSSHLVYVLNAGTPNNITGFTLGNDGSLAPIANSTRALSAPAVGPAQVQFTADGGHLVVTEKGPNLIDVFPVAQGIPGARVASPSHGVTPFGFAFAKRDRLLVSEAFGGAANASAASSYEIAANGTLELISGSVPTSQTAACWLIVTPSGSFAYTTNTGSRTVSAFSIDRDGALTLIPGALAQTPAGGPIDASFSGSGRYLHVLTANGATIVSFRAQSNGSLEMVGTIPAPPTAVGLAAN